MSIIKFRPKDKWMTCDLDGTIKIFRTFPVKGETTWTGKGCQILSSEHATGISISWESEPVKVVEHRAFEVCDFNLL